MTPVILLCMTAAVADLVSVHLGNFIVVFIMFIGIYFYGKAIEIIK